MVGSQYAEKKRVTSLYFGGGTPALVAGRLKETINTCREYFEITEGIGLELHPDNVTVDTLQILKDAGVTKISISKEMLIFFVLSVKYGVFPESSGTVC